MVADLLRKYFFAQRIPGGERVSAPARWASLITALAVVSLFFWSCFSVLRYHWTWETIWTYRGYFGRGWLITLGLSVASLALSTLLGLGLALMQRSSFLPFRYLSRLYVEIARGTPLLVQVLVLNYVVASALHVGNRYVVGILILSLYSGAYISEIIRAGIDSVGESQLESARAIGLTSGQTYRHLIFPQALRHMVPPLSLQLVSLIKDSSLLSVIAINEFSKNAQEVAAVTYSAMESYLPLALGYLILTLPLSLWTRRLAAQYRYET
jgi:polar amino acid transport system permease protein